MSKLAEKITSEEEWEQVSREARIPPHHFRDSTHTAVRLSEHFQAQYQWWANREAARLAHGIYDTTPVLLKLNKLFPIFAHISTEDPNMVAFTPDAASGERDKQLRITPGKLFSRYLPVLKDEVIRDLVAEHLSHANLQVEFVEGEDLVEMYKSNFGYEVTEASRGVTSCMTKGADHWLIHPAVAYNTPGVRLAFYRDAEGTIRGRSLVVEGENKRRIRVYPADSPLKAKLERMGYVAGGWEGVKFNTVALSSPDSYAFPYLDSYDGLASDKGSTVALLDGVITGIATEHRKLLRGWKRASAPPSYILLEEDNDSSRFQFYDDIRGRKVNGLLEGLKPQVLHVDGHVFTLGIATNGSAYEAAKNALLDVGYDYEEPLWAVQNFTTSWQTEFFLQAEPPQRFRDSVWEEYALDTDTNRKARGHVTLHPKCLPLCNPEERDVKWWNSDHLKKVLIETTAEGEEVYGWVPDRKDDTWVSYFNAHGDLVGMLPTALTGDETKITYKGRRAWAHKDCPVQKTRSGRTVPQKFLEKMWDGTWDLKTNVKRVVILGAYEFSFGKEGKDYYLALDTATKTLLENFKESLLGEGECSMASLRNYLSAGWSIFSYIERENFSNILREGLVHTHACLSRAAHSDVQKGLMKVLELKLAEMNAVEAPARLEVQVPETPEQPAVAELELLS